MTNIKWAKGSQLPQIGGAIRERGQWPFPPAPELFWEDPFKQNYKMCVNLGALYFKCQALWKSHLAVFRFKIFLEGTPTPVPSPRVLDIDSYLITTAMVSHYEVTVVILHNTQLCKRKPFHRVSLSIFSTMGQEIVSNNLLMCSRKVWVTVNSLHYSRCPL